MDFLAVLWLPILLSSVFVFIASSIIHMATPLHKGDFKKLPGEEAVLETLRGQKVAPGEYMFPCAASMKDAGTPEMIEKYNRGPCGFMTVVPDGPAPMTKNLILWFVNSLLISVFVAYVANLALPAGVYYLKVFQITGTVGIVGYAIGEVQNSIWKGRSWGITFKFIVSGIIYGLITAGVFGWLWPA